MQIEVIHYTKMKVSNFFHNNCSFKIGANKMSQIPAIESVEVAFAGRSNVGKSSLINAIINNKKLARTSKTPGCTSQINFFNFEDSPFYLIDLPGYGYAQKSKKELMGWSNLIYNYLKGRPQLYCVFILVDSRHGLKSSDKQLLDFTKNYGISSQIILTKIDKVSVTHLKSLCASINNMLPDYPNIRPNVISTSSINKDGIMQIKELLIEIYSSYNN